MNNSYQNIFCLIGYRFINLHLSILNSNFRKIKLNSDIEYLHKARVASRKIRSALKVFGPCTNKNELLNFSADIKEITRSLGDARDLDVQIKFLKDVIHKTKKKKVLPGIKTVLEHKQVLRRRIQDKLQDVLTDYGKKNNHPNYSNLFRENFKGARLYTSKAKSAIQYSKFLTTIQQLIIEILSLNDLIKDKKNINDLHNLRILIKKLRYGLELIYPYFQKELDKKLLVLKKLQEILGIIHDMDVWIEYIPTFIKKEIPITKNELNRAASNKNIKIGINYLSKYCKMKREKQFNKFYSYWEKIMKKKFWNDLIKIEYPA